MTKYVKSFLRHYTYAHPNELVKPVKDGDEIHLIIMLPADKVDIGTKIV